MKIFTCSRDESRTDPRLRRRRTVNDDEHGTPAAAERQADVIVVGAGPAGSTAASLPRPGRRRRRCCWRRRRSRARRSAATGSPRARSASSSGWASTSTSPAGSATRACASSAAATASSCRGPTSPTTRASVWSAPGWTSTRSSPATPRRPAPACTSGPPSPGPSSTQAGRIVGVTAKPVDDNGRKVGDEVEFRAPIVVAADGNSTRLSLAMGLQKRDDRPMGVAVRTYYTSPRHDDDWLESWLELWDGKPGESNAAPRLRLDLRGRRRHRQRRPRHPQHLDGLPERRLQGPAQALARPHAGGVGLPRREHGRPGPRRGAADGLQPQAALRQRHAAGRRRGRHGQPVQRRGHRVRHGVRRDGGRRDHPGAQPYDARGGTSAPSRDTSRRSTSATAATTRSAASS